MGELTDDIEWFTPDGITMTADDWQVSYARSLGVFLNGDAITAVSARGERVIDDSFYAIFNAYEEPLDFVLPDGPYAERWLLVVDTAHDDVEEAFPTNPIEIDANDKHTVAGRSVAVLRAIRPGDDAHPGQLAPPTTSPAPDGHPA